MSPFLHDRMRVPPDEHAAADRDARGCVSPFASSRQLSSITTLSPMRILCGCRSTTFCPKTTLRPQAPSSDGYSALRSASPSAPGIGCAHHRDQLVPDERAQPGLPDDERLVLRPRRHAAVEQLVLRAGDGGITMAPVPVRGSGFGSQRQSARRHGPALRRSGVRSTPNRH